MSKVLSEDLEKVLFYAHGFESKDDFAEFREAIASCVAEGKINLDNVRELRDYVAAHRDIINLKMKRYAQRPIKRTEKGAICNVPTYRDACCLVGHAPAVIPVEDSDFYVCKSALSYYDYAYRAFFNGYRDDNTFRIWIFLFDHEYDDAVDKAIFRLSLVLFLAEEA